MVTQFCCLERSECQNLTNLKFQMAAAAILKNKKNRHISATVQLISTKFGTEMQIDPIHHHRHHHHHHENL